MTDSTPPARGRPKGDKRARTRAKLIEAARELTREKGYERTTMEEIARRAGMTTGAIYGNFRNRDELYIALAQTYWAPIRPKIRKSSSFADKMRALAEATLAALPERETAVVGYLSGRAYAFAHPDVLARAREVTARSYAEGAAWLEAVADEEGLPMPAPTLIAVIHALMEGLVLQRLLTPDLVPDEAFYAAFEAIARPSPEK